MSAEVRNRVRELVGRLLQGQGDAGEFGDQEGLISGGRLQSVDVVEIVVFLEETWGVDFAEIPFDPDAFDSIDGVVELVEGATGG